MDPNQALADIRADAASILDGSACCAAHGEMAAAELALKFRALDEWLTQGGFPPEVWVH